MPLLTYEEFVDWLEKRKKRDTNRNIREFLERYRRHRYNESGHFKQAYWASVLFFRENPEAKAEVLTLPAEEPIDFSANEDLLEAWRYFLNKNRADRSDVLGFDLEVLYRGLHENLGGRLTSGGGAGFPLKIVMRLVADLE